MIFAFQERFWAKVASGEKRHTIRNRRPHSRVGMIMHCDGRVRTRDQFRLLVPEPECTAIDTIVIHEDAIHIRKGRLTEEGFVEFKEFIKARWYGPAPAALNGHTVQGDPFSCLSPADRERLAQADGFESWASMLAFWLDQHGPECLPFVGEVYYW